jgi:hypothetical protein
MSDLTLDEKATNDETWKHINQVQWFLGAFAHHLQMRGIVHDQSKLVPPEVSIFTEYTPKLKHSTYGSDEYKGFLAEMKPALDHHYAHNSHHPEHFDNGINGMTLLDLIEMLADWKAATMRHADGDIGKSLAINRGRFGISDQLAQVLENTAKEMGWLGR